MAKRIKTAIPITLEQQVDYTEEVLREYKCDLPKNATKAEKLKFDLYAEILRIHELRKEKLRKKQAEVMT